MFYSECYHYHPIDTNLQKKPVTFFETVNLPHPPEITNKVCLFTTDEAKMKAAENLGVHAIGSQDIVTKVSVKLSYDIFILETTTSVSYTITLLYHNATAGCIF